MSEPRHEADYKITLDELRRRTPRAYGGPPEDGDGLDPATATAYVEQPPPRPSSATVEGMIASIGQLAAAASVQGDSAPARRQRRMAAWFGRVDAVVLGLPAIVAFVGWLQHWF
jgi:hypothetical protein